MKKVVAVFSVVALLAIGATAFAHGPGWGQGYMMGEGYGPCSGPGGGPAACFGGAENDEKFLDETAELRRELHQKRFEYREAVRDPKTEEQTVATLNKEIDELQRKISEKAPKGAYGMGYGRRGGYGCRW